MLSVWGYLCRKSAKKGCKSETLAYDEKSLLGVYTWK